MARTFITSFAANSLSVDTGANSALASGITYDTTIVRTGPRSLKIVAPSATNRGVVMVGSLVYMRAYIRVTARPSTTARVIMGQLGASTVNVRLNPNGTLAYYLNTTLIGTSTTALTDTSRWYCVEVAMVVPGTGLDLLKIDGVVAVVGDIPGVVNAGAIVGPADTVADTYTAYFTDIAVDDGGFPGPGSVVLSVPISDNNRGAWTAGAGGTTNLFDAVNNLPPVGVATASQTNTSQIKSATNSATDNCDFNMQSYTTAGVPAGATIIAVQATVVHGEEIATGTKNGALLIVSNPAQGSEDVFLFGDDVGAEGTYPTNWRVLPGSVQGSPTVTLGTSPVVRVGKRTATTRVVSACYVGLYIEYLPALTGAAPNTGALSLTGFAPNVAVTNNQNIAAGAGALSLIGFAPTVGAPRIVLPGAGALSLSGFSPTVNTSNNQTVATNVGALSLTGFAPTVAISGGASAITFPATTGYAVAANTAAIGNATALAVKIRLRGDAFNPATNGYHKILQVDAALTGGANLKFILAIRADTSAGGIVMYDTVTGGLGAKQLGNIAKSGFDVTKYYILYFHYDPSSGTEKMRAKITLDESPFTSMLDTSSNVLLTGALLAGSTMGIVRVHRAYDAIGIQSITVDGLAIYSAILATGDRATEPAAADANLLAYWPMSEGSGTSTAEINGGNALTLTAATWETEGSWPSAGGGGATVSPGVGDLTLTGFAPNVSVSDNKNVLTGAGALSLTGFAPSVVVGTRVLTGIGSLTLTGFAPSVTVSNNQNVPAGAGALLLSGFAPSVVIGTRVLAGVGVLSLTGLTPTIVVSNNQNIAAGLGAITLSGFAPNIVVGVRVLPGSGSLTLTGFAPTVSVSNNQNTAAGLGAITLSGFAPAIAISNNQKVAAGAGALALSGFAPTVFTGTRVLAGVGALTLTGFSPTISVSNKQNVLTGTGALALTGFAPSAIVNIRVLAGAGAITFTGFAPAVSISDNKNVQAGIGALSLTGFAPTVVLGIRILANIGVLTLSGFAPTVSVTDRKVVLPGTGALTYTGQAPTVTVGNVTAVNPGKGALTLTGFAPSVTVSNNRVITPGTGAVTFNGFAPTVTAPDNRIVAPSTGAVVLAGFAPTVTATDIKTILTDTGILLYVGYAPTVTATDIKVAAPGTGLYDLTGFAPSVIATDTQIALPDFGELILTGFAPVVIASSNIAAAPLTGELVYNGYSPTIIGVVLDLIISRTALVADDFIAGLTSDVISALVMDDWGAGLTGDTFLTRLTAKDFDAMLNPDEIDITFTPD